MTVRDGIELAISAFICGLFGSWGVLVAVKVFSVSPLRVRGRVDGEVSVFLTDCRAKGEPESK